MERWRQDKKRELEWWIGWNPSLLCIQELVNKYSDVTNTSSKLLLISPSCSQENQVNPWSLLEKIHFAILGLSLRNPQ